MRDRPELNFTVASCNFSLLRIFSAVGGRTDYRLVLKYTEAGLKFRFPVRVAEHLSPTRADVRGRSRKMTSPGLMLSFRPRFYA